MLPLELVRPNQVEFGAVGIREEFVVQRPIRGQADQRGGGRQGHRQTGARAVVQRVTPGEQRRSHVVEIGGIVELISRLRDQHLVVGQRNSSLVVDVARQQQVRPAIEHHAQLAACGGDVIAAKRMVRMLEVADETVPDASRERDRPHHSVAFERPAQPRVRAKLAEVSGCELGGRLEVIGGRAGIRFIAPPTALRPYNVPCGPRSTSMRSRSRNCANTIAGRARETAVQVHRRARIRSGEQQVGADAPDRELAPAGVLRNVTDGASAGACFDGLGAEAARYRLARRH